MPSEDPEDQLRFDVARLSPRATLTPQGFLRAPASFTRAGVFEYTRTDGSRVRELRPPEEVFDAESLATLSQAPVTIGHPVEGSRPVMVDPSNAQKFTIGFTGERVDRVDMHAAGAVLVHEGSAIARLKSRDLCELSAGYRMRIDATPGVHPIFGAYDCVQRRIRYNHVALLQKNEGRAGSDVGVRLDGQQVRTDAGDGWPIGGSSSTLGAVLLDAMELRNMSPAKLAQASGLDDFQLSTYLYGYSMPDNWQEQLGKIAKALDKDPEILVALVPKSERRDSHKEPQVETEIVTIGGVEFKVEKTVAQAYKVERQRLDSQAAQLKADAESIKGRFDAKDAEAKDLAKKLADAQDPARLDSVVAERAALVANAKRLHPEAKATGGVREIRAEVLGHLGIATEGKSDEYLAARFDALVEKLDEAPEPEPTPDNARADHAAIRAAGAPAPKKPDPETRTDSKGARERMLTNARKEWEQPLGVTK